MSTLQTDQLQTLDGANTHDVANMGIETIVNGNHTAVKFPDGTLICYGFFEGIVNSSNASNIFGSTSGVSYRNIATVTFPVEFISVPVVTSNSKQAWVTNQSHSTTGVQLELWRGSNITINYAEYQAIGRWK